VRGVIRVIRIRSQNIKLEEQKENYVCGGERSITSARRGRGVLAGAGRRTSTNN